MANKVQTRNKLYTEKLYTRTLVRDCIEGSDAIKRGGELYLPMPEGFLIDPTAASSVINSNNYRDSGLFNIQDAPFYHRNHAYMSYLHRARFPDLPMYALKGLVGTAANKNPELKLPSKIKYLEESAAKNMNINELFAILICEVLSFGNVALVVEIDPVANTVYFVIYNALSTINWRDSKLSVFEYIEEKESADDPFDCEDKTVNIVYRWGKNPESNGEDNALYMIQEKYVDGDFSESIVPNLQGTPFEELPVVFIGAVENTPCPQTPPIIGICEIALSIYKKDADLSNAEYMTCNPNLIISGVNTSEGIPNYFGSTVALILEEAEAKAYYTQTDTSALAHVDSRIKGMFEEAMLYGAALAGPSKKGVEAAETVKIRQASQGASLVDVVRNVAKGIEKALEIAAIISGANPEEVEFIPNIDFTEMQLSPQMLQALNQACLMQNMSKRSLLENMKEAGLIKDVEEELARINEEGPTALETLNKNKNEK